MSQILRADTTLKDGDNLVYASTETLINLRQAGESLSLKASRIASRQSGNYLSRFKGRGMEFDEARLYQAGDDVRCLDWRVTARTGQPHTKVFREERERTVLTWVDMRPTMFFATRGAFKSVIASRIAALIAWSANHQGDRLGGLVFNTNTHHELRPKRGKKAVLMMLQQLSQASRQQNRDDEQELDANNALARLRQVTKPGSLVFLISDFRNLGPRVEAHLAQLSRHNDVVLLHIYDPLEQALPGHGSYRVTWGSSNSIFNSSRQQQAAYQQRFQQQLDRLKQLCRFPGVFYIACPTDANVVQTLQYGLGMKQL